LLPPLHDGDRGGWWTLKDLAVTRDDVRASYRLNAFNRPAINFDRRTGRLSIFGIEKFYGRCFAGW